MTSEKRFYPGFISARGRRLGPRLVARLLEYHDGDKTFRTDQLAELLEIDTDHQDRHFVTQFCRRLARTGVIANASTKRKYKEWRVVDSARLQAMVADQGRDISPAKTPPEYAEFTERVAELLAAGHASMPLEEVAKWGRLLAGKYEKAPEG